LEVNKRVAWIDSLKGIGILLIVLGHTSSPFNDYIFWFHVPLFFILSGLTSNFEYTPKVFIRKKINSLLLPYITFGVFILVINFIVERISPFIFIKNILKLIYGGVVATGIIGAYWFVLVLFLVEIALYFLVRKASANKIWMILISSYVVIYLLINWLNISIKLPWDILAVPIGSVFTFFGYNFKNALKNPNKKMFISACVTLIGSLMITYLFNITYKFDMKYLLSNHLLLDLTVPLSISVILIQLFSFTQKNKIHEYFAYLGEASLVIMFVHNLFIDMLSQYTNSNWFFVFVSATILSYTFYYLIIKTTFLNEYFFLKLRILK